MRRNAYFDYPLSIMQYTMVKGTETSSQEVKYLPFYAVDDYNRYSNNIYIGTKDTIIFGLPETKNINITYRSFTNLAEFLKGDYTQMAKFTSKDVTVYGGKGILLDDTGKILFMIVTDSRYWKKSEYDKMFLSSAFYQPQYKTVYKKVFDNFIYPALQEGVRMEVMSSKEIKDTVYKSLTPTINDFQSIDEYNEQIRAAIEKAFLKEEEILFPVIRDRDETSRLIDEMTVYEYGKLVTEACLLKMLDEIWELYQKSDNAFIASYGIVSEYIREYGEGLEWQESEIIEEEEDEMEFFELEDEDFQEIESQPLDSELNEERAEDYGARAAHIINEAIEGSINMTPRGSGILEQMMTGEAPVYQTLTPEIVESAVERIFAEPVTWEERPDMGTVTVGIDPAGVAPTDTQVLRGVISSSDEEPPF